MTHLDESAIEAVAADRDDLLEEAQLDHLDDCDVCAAQIAMTRDAMAETSVALRRAAPEVDGLDLMIVQALKKSVDTIDAPSRRSLKVGAAIGGLAAAALAILSLPGPSALSAVHTAGRQVFTLGRAANAVVASSVPGGWATVALAGLMLVFALWFPTRFLLGPRAIRRTPLVGSTLALVMLLGASSFAWLPASTVRAYSLEGEWPEPQPTVTLDVDQRPVREVLTEALTAAQLGVVMEVPEGTDLDRPITLHVRDAPVGEVVEALLATDAVVVRPSARMVVIRPEPTAPATPTPSPGTALPDAIPFPPATPSVPAVGIAVPVVPVPPMPELMIPPRPPHAVADRMTFGDDIEIGPDEQVRGVFTMGGDAAIHGRAYGDVVTMGGDAAIDGEVIGNVTTMGGDIAIEEGAIIHGDLNAMGGEIEVAEGTRVHGQMLVASDDAASRADLRALRHHTDEGPPSELFRWALWNVLIFMLGLVMMGTAAKRYTTLRTELHQRPVRSMFGGLLGMIAGAVLTGVLVLTIIGIPGAIVVGVMLFGGFWVGWATTAWWIGSVMPIKKLKDRPVLQLGAGVATLFIIGLVPKVGMLFVTAMVFAGLGATIATKFGKQAVAKRGSTPAPGPYRAEAS